MSARNILVVGIDTVKQKNLYQFDGLGERGWRFTVITTDSFGVSNTVAGNRTHLQVVSTAPRWPRASLLWALVGALWRERFDVAELYPGSVLQMVCAAILRLARVPVLIIARGEEYWYVNNRMSVRQRWAFRMTYRLTTAVLYKELYMEAMLDSFGIAKRRMLPNAVSIPPQPTRARGEGCVFLFMNTFKFFRHPELPLEAFLRVCEDLHLRPDGNIRLLIVGAQGADGSAEALAKETQLRAMLAGKHVPVEIHPWTEAPASWIDRSDVFLLPADVVFLNYTLLEAMAREVPAIIQDAEGASLIVNDGVDGFIAPADADAWYEKMKQLIENQSLRIRMGAAARATVIAQFGYASYLDRYESLYQSIARSPDV